MKKRINNNTFNAKVDIVTSPDNIKFYSQDRNDYTELALTAIKQKANVIKYISPLYKDYSILCEEVINQDCDTFLLISDNVSNYKQLGIKAIMKYPFLVSSLSKETKHYYFFWELAVSICYRVLGCIHENKKELFPLIEKVIFQEPLAIFHVNSSISIYSNLCDIAYSKNKESIKYMNINCVNKNLAFEIINEEPEKVRYLDSSKDFYQDACKLALSLNGQLIKNIYCQLTKDNLDYLLELINIAEKNAPEIVDYPIVFKTLCLENRKRKEKLLSTPNVLGNNIYKLLEAIDEEYKSLSEEYKDALLKEIKKEVYTSSDSISDCPIKVKQKIYN